MTLEAGATIITVACFIGLVLWVGYQWRADVLEEEEDDG